MKTFSLKSLRILMLGAALAAVLGYSVGRAETSERSKSPISATQTLLADGQETHKPSKPA